MIEIIEGLPDNVVGIVARGRVTAQDCREVLGPAMRRTCGRHQKIRLYYELSSRFPGAAWEDLKIGIERVPRWERVAVVTDVGWIRHTVNALSLLIPGEVRVFATIQAPEGRAWITATRGRRRRVTPRKSAPRDPRLRNSGQGKFAARPAQRPDSPWSGR